jgi:energy-coupling factor transporter ATP-binding protein EcfA2
MERSPNIEALLDPLVPWMELALLDDDRVSLTEVAASGRSAKLHEIFVDLPCDLGSRSGERNELRPALQLLSSEHDAIDLAKRLVLGGPGQGKSTITRALMQRARAALLRGRARAVPERAEDVSAVLDGYARLDASSSLEGAPRWLPLRVDLSQFAEYLPNNVTDLGGDLVLRWLHERASRVLAASGRSEALTLDALRAAVSGWGDVLLLIDGLDEVPRSARRGQVSAAIRDFVAAFGTERWRTVVTTRPQGYDGVFDDFAPVTLVPLDYATSDAIAARAFATWFERATDERETIRQAFDRLRRDPNASAFVHSPLFVSILLVAIEVQPDLAGQRWTLLETFYDTILKREQRKQTADGADILRFAEPIASAHRRVALILHAEAETGERTASVLSAERFATVVREIFRQRGEREPELSRKVETVVRLARERLVLLVSRAGDGSLGFDVRLFQEFFAAWALVVERHTEPGRSSRRRSIAVCERFAQIALVSHWVQVVLLAASATTSKWPEHRESLTIDLLEQLAANPVHPLARVVELALLMLRERVDHEHPDLEELLVRFSVRLLEIAPTSVHLEFAELLAKRGVLCEGTPLFSVIVDPVLTAITGPSSRVAKHSAWVLLQALAAFGAADNGDSTALDRLIDELWPADRAEEDALIHALYSPIAGWSKSLRLGRAQSERDMSDVYPRLNWSTQDRVIALAASRPLLRLLYERWQPGIFEEGVEWDDDVHHWREAYHVALAVEGLRYPISALSVRRAKPIASLLGRFCLTASERALLAFWDAPTIDALAATINLMEADLAIGQDWPWHWGPWPVVALYASLRSRPASQIASDVRHGRYGDPDDWAPVRAPLERTTRKLNLSLVSIESWLASDTAWLRAEPCTGVFAALVEHRAWELAERQTLMLSAAAAVDRVRDPGTLLKAVALWALQLPSEPAKVPLDAKLLIDPGALARVAHLRMLVEFNVDGFASSLRRDDIERWLDTFESIAITQIIFSRRIATQRLLASRSTVLALVSDRLRLRPRASALLSFALALMSSLRRDDPQYLVPPWFPHPTAFDSVEGQRNAWVISAASVRVYDRGDELIAGLIETLLPAPSPSQPVRYWSVTAAAELIAHGPVDDPRADALLRALLDRSELDDPELHSRLLAMLDDRAERRRGNLALDSVWRAHDLPLPAPMPPPVTMLFDQSTVRLASLEAHDLRSLGGVRLDVTTTPNGNDGSWVVLIGPNGAGKTTLLRAIALALDPSTSRGMLDRKPPAFRALGSDRGRVSVGLSLVDPRGDESTRGFDVAVVGRADAPTVETIEASTEDEGERPWVVGYGARRGSAIGDDDRTPSFSPAESLASLFDQPFTLTNAEAWLLRQRSAMLEELAAGDGAHGPAKARFEHIIRCIRGILPGEPEVEFINGNPCFTGEQVGSKVRLAALSDGYVTTLGWILDLMARWVQRWSERHPDHPMPEPFTQHMTGVVLLDEIDLHLHPLWQIQIIEKVRALFPRLSFVTTTHNPLTILGARDGEVFAVRRESGGGVSIQQRDVPRGLAVDQILTGPWFGMSVTLDRETQTLLDRHWTLRYVDKVPADHHERREIEKQLAERIGPAGASWVDALRTSENREHASAQARTVLDALGVPEEP